jgi:YVTN family beta-propeller protein
MSGGTFSRARSVVVVVLAVVGIAGGAVAGCTPTAPAPPAPPSPAPPAEPFVGEVALGGDLVDVVLTPDGSQAWIVPLRAEELLVLDTRTGALLGAVPVDAGFSGIAMAPDGSRAYVTEPLSGRIAVVDTATRAVVATVPVGADTTDVAITPDGRRLVVAEGSARTVSLIDTAALGTASDTFPVAGAPTQVLVAPGGDRIYALVRDRVVALDPATGGEVASIPAGPAGHMALTADGMRLYLTAWEDGIRVVDTGTGAVLATWEGEWSGAAVALAPDGARAYVTDPVADIVVVIDTATGATLATLPTGYRPSALAISPDGRRAYVVSEHLTVLDLAAR